MLKYSNGYGEELTSAEIFDRHFGSAPTPQESDARLVKFAEAAYEVLTEEQKLQIANIITPFKWKPL